MKIKPLPNCCAVVIASCIAAHSVPSIAASSAVALQWSSSHAVMQAGAPASVSSRFSPGDLRVYASATHLLPIDAIGLQCQGLNTTLQTAPAAHATNRIGKTSQRFGPTTSPTGKPGGAINALRFALDSDDVLPADVPPRCEMLAYPTAATGLPYGVPFWFALSIWVDDWAGTDDEQIIAQWHQNDPRLSLNPFLAFVVKGNSLRVELRHDASELATKASTTTVMAATLTVTPRQWMRFVVRARIAQDDIDHPFLQLWLDDGLVADYTGPLGYKLQAGYFSYPKTGIYKWLNGNPWQQAVPRRQVLVEAMLVVKDEANRYDEAMLSSAVAPP